MDDHTLEKFPQYIQTSLRDALSAEELAEIRAFFDKETGEFRGLGVSRHDMFTQFADPPKANAIGLAEDYLRLDYETHSHRRNDDSFDVWRNFGKSMDNFSEQLEEIMRTLKYRK